MVFFRYIPSALLNARTPITLAICVGIWLLAFAIISPIVFNLELFGHSFGQFGWDPGTAICYVRHSSVEGSQPKDVVFVFGVAVPFLLIFARWLKYFSQILNSQFSYVVLGLCHRRRHGETNGLVGFHSLIKKSRV